MTSVARTRSEVRSYRDLRAWNAGMDLVVASYEVARELPRWETYGLAAQIRRAAISVPANIAEGHGRTHLGDYLRFLSIANGSLMELETEILACERLGFIDGEKRQKAIEVASNAGRMVAGLKRSLGQKLRTRPRPDT